MLCDEVFPGGKTIRWANMFSSIGKNLTFATTQPENFGLRQLNLLRHLAIIRGRTQTFCLSLTELSGYGQMLSKVNL